MNSAVVGSRTDDNERHQCAVIEERDHDIFGFARRKRFVFQTGHEPLRLPLTDDLSVSAAKDESFGKMRVEESQGFDAGLLLDSDLNVQICQCRFCCIYVTNGH